MSLFENTEKEDNNSGIKSKESGGKEELNPSNPSRASNGLIPETPKDRRVKCMYCNQPVHIDRLAAITKKGMICNDTFCLLKFVEEQEKEKND